MPVKNIIPGQRVKKEKLQRARDLRRDITPAEKTLWQELRSNKLGIHFRRQQIIAGFIVDFYCHKGVLVVEVDGDIHDLQQEDDALREKVLREMGLTIVRFRNEDVIKDLPAVVGRIRSLISI
jgi:very-short-patch-repair endonuclease